MQAEMEAQAKRLDELVAQMNSARSADKVDKVAAALTELVSQHKAMHRRMMGPGGMMTMPPQEPGPTLPPTQGRDAEPVLPQAHDQHTRVEDDAPLCLPGV